MFKNLSINWEKYVFHLDKGNFELIGYSAHNTDSKGPTYINLEMISKVLIILFLLCLWG